MANRSVEPVRKEQPLEGALTKEDLYATVIKNKNINRLKQYADDITIDWFRETSLGKTVLHHAASINSDDALPQLKLIWEKLKTKGHRFKASPTPDILDVDSATPLHHAVLYGSLAAVKYLLEQGANTDIKMDGLYNRPTPDGRSFTTYGLPDYTPLHCATLRNDPAIITCLIQHGADLCAVNNANERADQILPARDPVSLSSVVPLQLHVPVQPPNFIANEARTLEQAIKNCDVAIVKKYAEENSSWLELPLGTEGPALFHAIHSNHIELVKFIVETLAPTPGSRAALLDNFWQFHPDGPTALPFAVYHKRKDMVAYFINQGIDLTATVSDSPDISDGGSILNFAVLRCSDAEIIKLLLDKNKHLLAITNSEGKTPNELVREYTFPAVLQKEASKLAWAIQNGDLRCVYNFAENNIHWLDIRLNDDQQTALHIAAQFNQIEILEFILSAQKQHFVAAIKQGDLWMVEYYTQLSPQWLHLPLDAQQQSALDIATDCRNGSIIYFISETLKEMKEEREKLYRLSEHHGAKDNYGITIFEYLAHHIVQNRTTAKNLLSNSVEKEALHTTIKKQEALYKQIFELYKKTYPATTNYQDMIDNSAERLRLIVMTQTLDIASGTSKNFDKLKKIIAWMPSFKVTPLFNQNIVTPAFMNLIEAVPQLLDTFIIPGDSHTQAKNLFARLNYGDSAPLGAAGSINVAQFISKLPVEIVVQHYELLLHLVELVTWKAIDRKVSEVALFDFLATYSSQDLINHANVLFFAGQLMQTRLSVVQEDYDSREDQVLTWYHSISKHMALIEYIKAQWACIHIYIGRGCEVMYKPMLNKLIVEIEQHLRFNFDHHTMQTLLVDAKRLCSLLHVKQEPESFGFNTLAYTKYYMSTEQKNRAKAEAQEVGGQICVGAELHDAKNSGWVRHRYANDTPSEKIVNAEPAGPGYGF